MLDVKSHGQNNNGQLSRVASMNSWKWEAARRLNEEEMKIEYCTMEEVTDDYFMLLVEGKYIFVKSSFWNDISNY